MMAWVHFYSFIFFRLFWYFICLYMHVSAVLIYRVVHEIIGELWILERRLPNLVSTARQYHIDSIEICYVETFSKQNIKKWFSLICNSTLILILTRFKNPKKKIQESSELICLWIVYGLQQSCTCGRVAQTTAGKVHFTK